MYLTVGESASLSGRLGGTARHSSRNPNDATSAKKSATIAAAIIFFGIAGRSLHSAYKTTARALRTKKTTGITNSGFENDLAPGVTGNSMTRRSTKKRYMIAVTPTIRAINPTPAHITRHTAAHLSREPHVTPNPANTPDAKSNSKMCRPEARNKL